MKHPTDRVCHLCGKDSTIFDFQTVYFPKIGSIYVCHECTISMQKAAITAKGLEVIHPRSKVS